jgi:ADP-heptose:LPS heptosyltransferase
MSHPAPNPLPQKPPLGLYGGSILFAAPHRWDEACFTVPAVRAIRAARPTCSLGVICHDEQRVFWETMPELNEIITYDEKTSLGQLLKEQKQSRYDWDSAIFWEKNLAAKFSYALKIKQRLSYTNKKIQRYLTDAAPLMNEPGPVEHRVQYYLRFMEMLRIPTQKPQLFVPASLHPTRIPGHVIVSPSSDYGSTHEWSLQRWTEIVNLLLLHCKASVTIVSLPQCKSTIAQELAALFSDQCQNEILPSYGLSLSHLASASLTIAADSSLCHLSAHVGTTTISLFGPNDPSWRRPLGRQHAVVRHKVECSPCLLSKCPLDRRCQNELTYEEVAAVVLEKWKLLDS